MSQRRQQRGLRAVVRRKGFTLLELLVVVAIIAILAGILLTAVGRLKTDARKRQAQSAAKSLVTACRAYHTEYREWPVKPVATSNIVYRQNNYEVIEALLPGGNPRQLAFIEIAEDQAGWVPGSTKPWIDPFKSNFPYQITISVPQDYVEVRSYGPDNASGTTDDIVESN